MSQLGLAVEATEDEKDFNSTSILSGQVKSLDEKRLTLLVGPQRKETTIALNTSTIAQRPKNRVSTPIDVRQIRAGSQVQVVASQRIEFQPGKAPARSQPQAVAIIEK